MSNQSIVSFQFFEFVSFAVPSVERRTLYDVVAIASSMRVSLYIYVFAAGVSKVYSRARASDELIEMNRFGF